MNQEEQEVYLRKSIDKYLQEEGEKIRIASVSEDAIRYIILPTEISINGIVAPKGSAIVSIFGSPFQFMREEDFSKWIIPYEGDPFPAIEAIQGKVIQSNTEDFSQYIQTNKLNTIAVQKILSTIEAIEARESLTILTAEGAKFEVHGGDFILHDPLSGNVWKQDASYFSKNYKQVPKEIKQ